MFDKCSFHALYSFVNGFVHGPLAIDDFQSFAGHFDGNLAITILFLSPMAFLGDKTDINLQDSGMILGKLLDFFVGVLFKLRFFFEMKAGDDNVHVRYFTINIRHLTIDSTELKI